jgi:hypothetical protein
MFGNWSNPVITTNAERQLRIARFPLVASGEERRTSLAIVKYYPDSFDALCYKLCYQSIDH